jgi:cardiolipin synthase A/B
MPMSNELRWLPSGQSGLAAMARLIEQAEHNIQLQTYIYRDDAVGLRLRDLLVAAARRGVRVRLLIDALGSFSLGPDFFAMLEQAGGELEIFNPIHPRRFIYRNHRKLLVCDRKQAVVGGFNLGEEYDGDGIERGWLDLGLALRGPMAEALAAAFDRLYVLAGQGPKRFARWRSSGERRRIETAQGELLLSGPGRGANPLKASLMRDLGRAERVRIVSPYFLPPWNLRRRLMKLARQGRPVQLLLPGKSDVVLAWHASRSIYARLIRAGVEILEYQPQILHAKLVLTDQVAYVGSANFNTRSFHIDYEVMVRLNDAEALAQAHGLFEHYAGHARRIDQAELRRLATLWTRLRQRVAYFVMARLDPLVAGWLWRRLRYPK